jgi:hypothetical protein
MKVSNRGRIALAQKKERYSHRLYLLLVIFFAWDQNGFLSVKGMKTMRYKERLVAQGFTQRLGIDFDETYSPVMSGITLAAQKVYPCISWM